jgi:uncharacterized membrane protein
MAISKRLDATFKVGVTLKGLDGALEMIGGLVLLLISPTTINAVVHGLTQHELARDPHDFVARHLVDSAGKLTHGGTIFASVYLLSHGIAKVVLVIAVLRQQVWAYPGMMALLGAFIGYQIYRLSYRFTLGLTLLTIFDAFVVWLTWREYQGKRPRTDGRAAHRTASASS